MLIVCIENGQWWYLFVTSAIAPFLLLRTKISTHIGVRLMQRQLSEYYLVDSPYDLSYLENASPLSNIVISILSLFYRIRSIMVVILRNPIECLKSVPNNWKNAFTSSILHDDLEVIPGYGSYPVLYRKKQEMGYCLRGSISSPFITGHLFALGCFIYLIIYTPQYWSSYPVARYIIAATAISYAVYLVPKPKRRGIRTVTEYYVDAFAGITASLFISIILVISLIYKWSLKSTLLIWSPIIYMTGGAFRKNLAGEQLLLIRKSVVEAIKRYYGLFTGSLMALKYVAMIFGIETVLIAASNNGQFIEDVIQPMKINVWQIVVIVNAALSWVLFFYCDKELIRREAGRGHDNRAVSNMIGTINYLRAFGATYTIGCSFWIVGRLALHLRPFPVDWQFLP